ncbi:KAP family NTPase [Vitreoscilla massiliensis]|uniref:KAP family NTPase n=1 Tax=Vitreoscilla massiliensis TaxID=1689272 RepID=A0ABY4E3N2_9NEIS|nr:P-loop NTPase fold protein [Vitreoscilla massiliensis]UOO89990.1 KAP family NTPase [Vitreoscilla massiliensis]
MAQTDDLNWQRDDLSNITEPFEHDLLNRKPLAEHLTRYIDRLKVGAVLALDARWGEGKTWFVMHWQKHLEQTTAPHKVIYINAFAQDHIDDPFLLIAAELRAVIAHDVPAQKKFTQKIMAVGKVLAPTAYKAAVSTSVKWITGINDGSDKLEKLQEQLIDATSEQVGLWVENQIKEHENNKNAITEFKATLKEVAQVQNKPIVIIVDELDRCNPLFSVRLIERIKHFFDIPNIVFVLVTDKKQLQSTICHQFGYNTETGKRYLEKFIDVTIELSPDLISKDVYLHFVTETLKAMNFSQDAITALKIDIVVYALAMKLSIREIKSKLHRFILYYFDKNTEKWSLS